MCRQLAAAAFDRLQVIELLLESFGVPPSELLIASGLNLCFACEGCMLVGRGVKAEFRALNGEITPFFTALAFSAFR